MTVSHSIEVATDSRRSRRPLVARCSEPVLAALLFALITGAWLAFFLFLPFDFTLPRP